MQKNRERKILFPSFHLLQSILCHEIIMRSGIDRDNFQSIQEMKSNLLESLTYCWKNFSGSQTFKSIFYIGAHILEKFPKSLDSEIIIREIREIVLDLIESPFFGTIDLLGPIYHNFLIQTKKAYYAPYYTSIPAAFLLTTLAIYHPAKDLSYDISSIASLSRIKMLDPACGSGILLSSLYFTLYKLAYSNQGLDNWLTNNVENNRKTESNKGTISINNKIDYFDNNSVDLLQTFHLSLLEDGIWGLDVMPFATALTQTTLSFLNPPVFPKHTCIFPLINGVNNQGKIFLGSLDLLTPPHHCSIENQDGSTRFIQLKPNSFDLVLMNPPFSRSANPNLKFGYKERELQNQMRKRLSEILRETNLSGVGQAGLGAPFTYLGGLMTKTHGRFLCILPRGFLSGVSWTKIRMYLAEQFEIEYIISNFDPGNHESNIEGWNWSQNTNLGEIMFIARKLSQDQDSNFSQNISYINLISKPSNFEAAISYAHTIITEYSKCTTRFKETDLMVWQSLIYDGTKIGWVSLLSKKRITANFHLGCVFAHPKINHFLIYLMSLFDTKILCLTIEDIVMRDHRYLACGRDIKQIKTMFSISEKFSEYPILQGHQGSLNQFFLPKSNLVFGHPKLTNIKQAQKIFDLGAANILIVTRPHLNSECLMACETEIPCLATAFWEIRLKPEYYKAKELLILWINSTFGFLSLLGYSVNSKAQIFKFKKTMLRTFQIPRKFLSQKIDSVQILYDSIKKSKNPLFLDQFKLAINHEGVRFQIDSYFNQLFINHYNIEFDLSEIYSLIVKEPSLTLMNYSNWQK